MTEEATVLAVFATAFFLTFWLPAVVFMCAYTAQFGKTLAHFRAIEFLTKGVFSNGNEESKSSEESDPVHQLQSSHR